MTSPDPDLPGSMLPLMSGDPPRTDAHTETARGIRAIKFSLLGLATTSLLQATVVALSGSVALLADTIHNLSDALTAVPLWIAFGLGRRPPTRRYPYGFHRAEDLAGILIVLAILASAALTAWQAITRLAEQRTIEHIPWVTAAGVVGFVGSHVPVRPGAR